MFRTLSIALLFCACFAGAQSEQRHDWTLSEIKELYPEPTSFIVKFESESVQKGLLTTDRIRVSNRQHGVAHSLNPQVSLPSKYEQAEALKVLNALSQEVGTTLYAHRGFNDRTVLYALDSHLSVDEIVKRLMASPIIDYAEYNAAMRPASRVSGQSINISDQNDPYYSKQNIFATQSLYSAGATSAGLARHHYKGRLSGVVNIALLDSGRIDHEDIEWAPGVDLLYGNGVDEFSESCNSGEETYEFNTESGFSPRQYQHGLMTAGVIGAKSDNGIGIAGLIPHEHVRLIPVLVVDDCGGNTHSVAQGILWSINKLEDPDFPENQHPADVINMSLSGNSTCINTNDENSIIRKSVIEAEAANAIMVASAGNNRKDAGSQTPANCPYTITVGAIALSGEPSTFTNFGPVVDVMALGSGVYTTAKEEFGYYTQYSGTSVAAPIVSGLIGLMRLIEPTLNYAQILETIQGTALPINHYSDGTPTSCATIGCGAGAVNFERPIRYVLDKPLLNAPRAQHVYAHSEKLTDAHWLSHIDEFVPICNKYKVDAGVFQQVRDGIDYTLHGIKDDVSIEIGTYSHPGFVFDDIFDSYLLQACDVNSGCSALVDLPIDRSIKPISCS